MKETTRDEHWSTPVEEILPDETLELLKDIKESLLILVTLGMRNYDLQLAMLNRVDVEKADLIYAAHKEGGHFNPTIFIPSGKPNVD